MKIDKNLIFKLCFWIFFGILVNSFELISIRKICQYPEHGPFFYGFPMIYRTNMTWVNSGSGIIYLFGTLVNAIFWGGMFFGFFQLVAKCLSEKFSKIIIGIMAVIAFLNFLIVTNAYELDFKLHHEVKMDYYQQDIECNRSLKLFNFWLDEALIENDQPNF